MTTVNDVMSAVARSISHNEIVRVNVEDRHGAIMELRQAEGVEELDYTEVDVFRESVLDVWGAKDGREWRIYIGKIDA